jgi:hypothetical protein
MNRNADVKAHLQGDQRHGMDDGDLFEALFTTRDCSQSQPKPLFGQRIRL